MTATAFVTTAVLAASFLPLVQAAAPVLDNPYVLVTRNAAVCTSPRTAGCAADRILVALSQVEVNSAGGTKRLQRGDIAVFGPDASYVQPVGGAYFEVVLKADRPPVQSPTELLPPEKNDVIFDGEGFFVFTERLEPGDTRRRHSHSQRVVIQLNPTKLQQWPEGAPEVIRDMRVDQAAFNEPVIHVVKNVGERPLRGIVIEFKPQQKPQQ